MSENNDFQKISNGLKDANTIRKTAMKAAAGNYAGAAFEAAKNPMSIIKAIIFIFAIPVLAILSLLLFPTLMFSTDITDSQLAYLNEDSLVSSIGSIDDVIKEVYENKNKEVTDQIDAEIFMYKLVYDNVFYEVNNPLTNGEYYAYRSSYMNSIYSFLRDNHNNLSLASFKQGLENNIDSIIDYELTSSTVVVNDDDTTQITLVYTVKEMEPDEVARTLYGLTEGPPDRQVERVSDMANNLLSITDINFGMQVTGSFKDFTNSWIEMHSEEVDKTLVVNFTPNTKMISPTTGYISSKYGWRIPPTITAGAWHSGIDIAGSLNTPIITPANGVVIRSGNHNSYGLFVMIYHGKLYGVNYFTLYAHMNEIKCSDGDTLNTGDTIGLMGSTGDSTGEHLHFEVRKNTDTYNPTTSFNIQ